MTTKDLEVIAAYVERVAEAVVLKTLRTADLPRGPQGEKGADGLHGQRGEKGADGMAGRDGVDGEKGADGRDGKDGADGRDAVGIESAYVKDGDLFLRLTDGTETNAGRVSGEPGRDGIDGKDGADGINGKDGAPGRDGEKGIDGKDGSPGRDGRDGTKGDPGRDGKDGAPGRDGITPDMLDAAVEKATADTIAAIEFDGRTWKIGGRTIETAAPEYRGVYREKEEYARGDMVTWAGSLWHAKTDTTEKPGDGNQTWTLAVKRGRDGKGAA